MLKGTIIENSLINKDILKTLQIIKTWQDGDWILHSIQIDEGRIKELSESLNNDPWYIHLWEKGKDRVTVIFKNKIFTLNFSDKSTWTEAVNYGKSLGIPAEQLDFPID
jgi:hypothetical protein